MSHIEYRMINVTCLITDHYVDTSTLIYVHSHNQNFKIRMFHNNVQYK